MRSFPFHFLCCFAAVAACDSESDAVAADARVETGVSEASLADAGLRDALADADIPDVGQDARSGFTPSGIEVEVWPEANTHFGYAEDDWLGGDAVYSIPLGGERVFWMFGDSLVATSDNHVRSESVFIRNSVAISTGLDPSMSAVDFMWSDNGGAPDSFFDPPSPEHWAWPGHGTLLPDGKLLLFLWDLRQTNEGLGFSVDRGYGVLVENPQSAPATWSLRVLDLGESFGAIIASAAYADDTHVYAVATTSDGNQHGYLVRYTHSALSEGRVEAEWFADGTWKSVEATSQPDVVVENAHTEASLHFDAKLARYVHVTSKGFGGAEAWVRVAKQITGPYVEVGRFKPPESMVANPFVYAFKAHPELDAGEFDLVITYATNSFEFTDLFTEEGNDLYRPRFARLRFLP